MWVFPAGAPPLRGFGHERGGVRPLCVRTAGHSRVRQRGAEPVQGAHGGGRSEIPLRRQRHRGVGEGGALVSNVQAGCARSCPPLPPAPLRRRRCSPPTTSSSPTRTLRTWRPS